MNNIFGVLQCLAMSGLLLLVLFWSGITDPGAISLVTMVFAVGYLKLMIWQAER